MSDFLFLANSSNLVNISGSVLDGKRSWKPLIKQSYNFPKYFFPGLPNPCRNNPCKNAGVCVPLGNGYSCRCRPQFGGIHCEHSQCKFEHLPGCHISTLVFMCAYII